MEKAEAKSKMSKKALYKHKKSGDLFAIETDENGKVLCVYEE